MELEKIKGELEKMVPGFAQRVAPLYQQLKWEWSPGATAPHVPSVGEIENELYSLIERLEGGAIGGETVKSDRVGCGGLEVFYEQPDEEAGEAGHYGLNFCLEEQKFFD